RHCGVRNRNPFSLPASQGAEIPKAAPTAALITAPTAVEKAPAMSGPSPSAVVAPKPELVLGLKGVISCLSSMEIPFSKNENNAPASPLLPRRRVGRVSWRKLSGAALRAGRMDPYLAHSVPPESFEAALRTARSIELQSHSGLPVFLQAPFSGIFD